MENEIPISANDIFVWSYQGIWYVRRLWSPPPAERFDTEEEAMNYANRLDGSEPDSLCESCERPLLEREDEWTVHPESGTAECAACQRERLQSEIVH